MTNKIDEALKLKIKDEFVHGFVDGNGVRQYPTIQALSKRHEVAYASLHRRSNSEDWQSQKNRVQTEYENAVTQERLQKMVDYGARLDDQSINLALAMLGDAGRRITEDVQNRSDLNNIASMEDGPAKEAALEKFRLKSKVLTPYDMSGIASTVSNAQKIGKLALGQAQEISKVSANVTTPDSLREVIRELDELATQKSSGAQHTLQ
jgi:hypothetical protein